MNGKLSAIYDSPPANHAKAMSNKLEVSFNSPQCGWMSIGFDDGAAEFHTTTAHAPHDTALAELLRIYRLLLTKFRADEYVLQWIAIGRIDFYFARMAAKTLCGNYQYPSEERANENREKVVAHAGNLREVAEAFINLHAAYEDRDTDEFEFKAAGVSDRRI